MSKGAASEIELTNKEYQKRLEDAAFEVLKTSDEVHIKIENGEWVLPYVASTFRNAGYEVSYNPDEGILSVRKDEQPSPVL